MAEGEGCGAERVPVEEGMAVHSRLMRWRPVGIVIFVLGSLLGSVIARLNSRSTLCRQMKVPAVERGCLKLE